MPVFLLCRSDPSSNTPASGLVQVHPPGMCPADDPVRPNRPTVQGMNFHVKTIVP